MKITLSVFMRLLNNIVTKYIRSYLYIFENICFIFTLSSVPSRISIVISFFNRNEKNGKKRNVILCVAKLISLRGEFYDSLPHYPTDSF